MLCSSLMQAPNSLLSPSFELNVACVPFPETNSFLGYKTQQRAQIGRISIVNMSLQFLFHSLGEKFGRDCVGLFLEQFLGRI